MSIQPVRLLGAVLRDIASGQVWTEWRGEPRVACQAGTVGPFPAWIAPQLVAQAVDPQAGLIASRGYQLYRFPPSTETDSGASRAHESISPSVSADPGSLDRAAAEGFRHWVSSPAPGGLAWAGRWRAIREATGRRDVVDVLPLQNQGLLVHAGGQVYRRASAAGPWRPVWRLRHWGLRTGRGLLHHGWTQLANGRILAGEYFHNPRRESVWVWASDDQGQTWQPAHQFPAGQIRHIHAVGEDPVTHDVWLCAGDSDAESRILRSANGGQTWEIVGAGSEAWRTCSLVFTPTHVLWAADTERNVAHRFIYRWCRTTGELEKLQALDGAAEFAVRLADLYIVATIRVGHEHVPDAQPSLWIADDRLKWIRYPLPARIHRSTRRPASAKIFAAENLGALGLSFDNVEGLDGNLALISIDALRHVYHKDLQKQSPNPKLSSG